MISVHVIPTRQPTIHTQGSNNKPIATMYFGYDEGLVLHIPGATWEDKITWMNTLYNITMASLRVAQENNDTD